MASISRNLFGGVVIILAALLIGIVHNSVRTRKIPLIVRAGTAATTADSRSSKNKGSKSPSSEVIADSNAEDSDDHGEAGEDIITIEEALEYFENKQAIFIDARSEKTYLDGHIPGSINVPYDKLPDYYDMLTSKVSKEQLVISYCWSPSCDFSDNLASELRLMGYENVLIFKGGWEEWTEKGYPAESGRPDTGDNQ